MILLGRVLTAHLLALGTTIIWGLTFISTKVLLESHTPLEIIIYRFSVAVAALFLLRPHIFRHHLGWRMELYFAGAGFCGVSLYFLLENVALAYTYASNVSIIICTAPFFTGLAACIFLGEKVFRSFFWGFLVAMAGIAIISFNGATGLGLNPLGDLLALLAALTWAFYSIFTRIIFQHKLPMLESTRRMLLWGLGSLLLILPFQHEGLRLPDFQNPTIIGNIIFLGLLASALCYMSWNFALRTLGAIRTTVYIYLTPAVTVAGAAFFLDEKITPLAVLGMFLTFTGLLLSENHQSLPKPIQDFGARGRGNNLTDNLILRSVKAVHLLFATTWAGGALSMQALGFLKISTAPGPVRDQIAFCLHFVDTWVVMPGLAGCLLTGLFYSVFTSIGFFKFAWIGYKWLISLSAGFWGTLFWGPWGDSCIEILSRHNLDMPLRFLKGCLLPQDMWQGAMQLAIILSMCLVSVYRPISLRRTPKEDQPEVASENGKNSSCKK